MGSQPTTGHTGTGSQLSSFRAGMARVGHHGAHTIWMWTLSLSLFSWAALLGAGAVLLAMPWMDATTHGPVVLTFWDATLRFFPQGDTVSNPLQLLATFALLAGCFSATVLIRSDSRGKHTNGQYSAWVGGTVAQTFVRHSVEALVWIAATAALWGIGYALEVAHVGTLATALPVLAFFTSPVAFLLAGATFCVAHAGLDGWVGMAAVPLTTPVLPAFAAIVWFTFTAADPNDRFEHWWPVRRDLVGPLLGLVWGRMDTDRFETALDAAVADARDLWQGKGTVCTQATEVVVRRQGTGVHAVSPAQTPDPNVAVFVARALGRRIAGRLPPVGTQTRRALAPDSAHAQMAVAARKAARTRSLSI